jgi:hypothetical protein
MPRLPSSLPAGLRRLLPRSPAQVAASPDAARAAELRHDLRGLLSPAMMVADRLIEHEDPAVRRAGEVVLRTVERITERLERERDRRD